MAHISAAERRPQLIQAAIDLMTREGVEAGSTRAIAAELGVAQATVHYVFGTKRDLYRAVLEHLTGELVERVREATSADDSFEESFRKAAGALWQGLRERSDRSLLFLELSAYALRSPELREVLRGYQRELEETAAGLLTGVADRTGLSLALPAHEVARFFLAGLDGIEQRHLLMSGTEAAPTAEGGRTTSAAPHGPDPESAARTDLDRLVTASLLLAGVE